MKILLVDDEQSILDIFGGVLQKAGHQIITSMNGTDGLHKAELEKPNLILLDQILPDMNGNDVLRNLKQNDSTKTIPIAILSNYTQDSMMQEAIKLGAVDYIMKYQIEPTDIVAKVNQFLGSV